VRTPAKIHVAGNLTRDPELFTEDGRLPYAYFGLAVHQWRKDRRTTQWVETTSFYNVVCRGSLAENVAASLGKGVRVVVVGRAQERNWQTEHGERRTNVEIDADDVAPSLKWATAGVTKRRRVSTSASCP
jgi:single-strand DNA-binding protein